MGLKEMKYYLADLLVVALDVEVEFMAKFGKMWYFLKNVLF